MTFKTKDTSRGLTLNLIQAPQQGLLVCGCICPDTSLNYMSAAHFLLLPFFLSKRFYFLQLGIEVPLTHWESSLTLIVLSHLNRLI